MSNQNTPQNLALFCDFENVALGVRDAKYDDFDINKVLEKLLVKGAIVVKKAYSDWERYAKFKKAMHEAAFELIDIPHVRMSGKNSADIRMVVDALDLCYTKSHVDTFVIISGDSDFSPLVSKLRENNKLVIGVGVKSSTSDLLMGNCDEFIFYDDLVRSEKKKQPRRKPAAKSTAKKKNDQSEGGTPEEAFEHVMETLEALLSDRDDTDQVWGSQIKQTLKRRRPGFNESFHGFKSFSELLEAMQKARLVTLNRDERSGGFLVAAV